MAEQQDERADLVGLNKPEPPVLGRWSLIRDLLVFQGKLVADGGRDLLLSPISIIVGVYALLRGGEQPGSHFYDLLHLGRRTEKWINLFGAADQVPPNRDAQYDDAGIDKVIDQLEELILTQYEKGGLTASAKSAIDRTINTLQRKNRNS